MPPICGTVAALAVAAIYYLWRAYACAVFYRERTLRQRVAYMLWVMANLDTLRAPDTDADDELLWCDSPQDLTVVG